MNPGEVDTLVSNINATCEYLTHIAKVIVSVKDNNPEIDENNVVEKSRLIDGILKKIQEANSRQTGIFSAMEKFFLDKKKELEDLKKAMGK